MIEGVEKFCPKLQLPSFRKFELLEQAQVGHLNDRAMEQAGSTSPEGSIRGNGKCGGIDEKTRRGIGIVIGGRTSKRIPYAVSIKGMGKTHQTIVRSSDTVWAARLQRHDSVELPSSEPAADCTGTGEEAFPLAERQIPDEIPDKTAANVEIRITHLRAVVVSVLRDKSGREVVSEIGESVTESVAQGVAKALGHLPAQGELQRAVVGSAIIAGVLEESMLASGSATGVRKGIDIRYRVQVGVGIHQNGTAIIEACHTRLIVITHAVH